MKIVFSSDIHGNLGAFREFVRQLEDEQPDRVFFCGDVFGYYYGQNQILTYLRESGWHCLLGNHDKYFLDVVDGLRDVGPLCKKYGSTYRRCICKGGISEENLLFLRSLKPQIELVSENLRIAVFHGSPEDPLEGRIYPDTDISETTLYTIYDYVICGHTHHKMLRRIGNTVLINPGSLGQQRDGKGCSYVVLDTSKRTVEYRIVSYDIAALLEEISDKDAGNIKLSEVLTRKAKG